MFPFAAPDAGASFPPPAADASSSSPTVVPAGVMQAEQDVGALHHGEAANGSTKADEVRL